MICKPYNDDQEDPHSMNYGVGWHERLLVIDLVVTSRNLANNLCSMFGETMNKFCKGVQTM